MSISDREIRHSTCVSVDGVGILIVGPLAQANPHWR